MSNIILLAQTPEPEFSAEHKTQNTIKHLQTSFTWWILAKLARRLTQGVPRGVPRGVTRLSPKNRCCWLNRLPAPGRSSEPNAGVKCQRLFLQIPNRGQGVLTSATFGIVRRAGSSAHAVAFGTRCLGQLLGEWRSLSQRGALPVDDIDGDDEHERDGEQDRACVLQVPAAVGSNVLHEGEGGDGQYTREEIASPAVATGGRG